VRVRVIALVAQQSMPNRLLKRVFVCPPRLALVANASIEVFVAFEVAPEFGNTLGQRIIDELGHRAVNALHHYGQAFAKLEVAYGVVMVAEERRHPGREAIRMGVMIEPIPKDCFGFFGRKGVLMVTHMRGDEVNLVIDQPMFVTMTPIDELGPTSRCFPYFSEHLL